MQLSKLFLFLILFLCPASCSGNIVKLKKFPPPNQVDVLVYGANPAGIISAISAIREGKSALIIEPTNRVGGIITGGLGFTDACKKDYIGGYAREYFQRIGARYGKRIQWNLEPHVGEEVFIEMLNENKVPIIFNQDISSVEKKESKIKRITLSSGKSFSAKVFIDASYEGDLLAKAGVSYRVGRESNSDFNETLAGFTGRIKRNHFDFSVSAYDSKGNLLPGVQKKDAPPLGTGDKQVMAYNYRPCLTKNIENQVPFPKPINYRESNYQILARYLKNSKGKRLKDLLALHETVRGKIDLNSKGPFSTDYLNASSDYVEASKAKRKAIIADHKTYNQGLLYFLANSKSVPEHIRKEMNSYGLCKDEFKKTNNWPHLLYVREGRKLNGEYVLSESDLLTQRGKKDLIAWATCRIEVHHNQRLIDSNGNVYNEGIVALRNHPYQIPYRSIVPKATEAENLIVPVAVSATTVAYSSLRMEPVFMILGQAAGVAASIAIDSESSVQDVDISNLQNSLRRKGQKL